MNYGYTPDSKNWDETKKVILAGRLITELRLKSLWIPGEDKPYVEIDGLYPGVRIRKITYLSSKEKQELCKKADRIYDEVMT